MMQYKSKTMQSLAAQRSDDLRLVQKFVADVGRMKQSLEELDGTRGNNPALRKSDLVEIAKVGMQSPTSGATIAELRADVQRLYDAIHKIANLYPSQKRGPRKRFGKNRD